MCQILAVPVLRKLEKKVVLQKFQKCTFGTRKKFNTRAWWYYKIRQRKVHPNPLKLGSKPHSFLTKISKRKKREVYRQFFVVKVYQN